MSSLADIVNSLLSSYKQAAPGVTYGPAESRRTHTPIIFGPADGNQGQFNSTSTPSEMATEIASNLPTGKGIIRIDPAVAQPQGIGSTIRHEDVHALMNRLPDGGKKIVQSISNYQQIAGRMGNRLGPSTDEVPAYMAAYQAPSGPTSSYFPNALGNSTNVPQDWRDQYVNELTQKLFQLDPQMAKTYQQLSQPQPQAQ